MKHSEDQEAELAEVRRERNDLEKRLNDLAKQPFFNMQQNDRVSVKTQLDILKVEKGKVDENLKNLREKVANLETEA